MDPKSKIVLAVVAGVALGAAAVQVLHAQATSKAYIVTETEVLDAAALAAYTPQVRAAIAAAGGRPVARAGGKTVAFVGQAPQRVGITEWDSMEKAQAYRNSAAYKDLAPQRDKAVKTIRAFAVDASAN